MSPDPVAMTQMVEQSLAQDPSGAKTSTGPADVRTKLTWQGRTYALAQSDVGPGDDAMCRAQTAAYTGGPGWTLTGLMQTAAAGDMATAGTDVVAVLLWTVRRKNGEPNLKLAEVFDGMSSIDLLTGLTVEVEVDDPGEAEPPGD